MDRSIDRWIDPIDRCDGTGRSDRSIRRRASVQIAVGLARSMYSSSYSYSSVSSLARWHRGGRRSRTTRGRRRADDIVGIPSSSRATTTGTSDDSSGGGGDESDDDDVVKSSMMMMSSLNDEERVMMETIAGRCAMVGYAVGATREATEATTMAAQTGTGAMEALVCVCVVAWASVKPFEFNPQEYDRNPMNLKGKSGMSGFLAMEALNLNCDVERAHGRMAMVGFAGTALIELVLGRGVFGGVW
tara:strand:+ start:245 stop:979 length:735 start_codon:yes stop_codon:yes gene_type:complete